MKFMIFIRSFMSWFPDMERRDGISSMQSDKASAPFGSTVRGRWRYLLFLAAAIPLAAYPLTLADYLNKSTVTASGDQFEQVFDNNEDQVQIIPNAELVIVKQVVNDDGGNLILGDFNVTSDGGTLSFPTVATAGSTTTYTSSTLYLSPGTYSLQEDDVAGYTEGSWSCTAGIVGNSAFDSGEISLAFGEQTVCTIVNDDIAPTLTLAKTLVNDNGGDLAVEDFDISIDGVEVASGASNQVLANTVISIAELDVAGYSEGTWACTDATGLTPTADLPAAGVATGASLTLAPGADVTCEITNDDIAPSLTLAKTLVNDDGGDLTIADFDISIDAVEVASGVATPVLANTAIAISELDVAGYTEGTWACTDANGLTAAADLPAAGVATATSVTLEPGSDVTCEITNDDIAPLLTLTKILVNDNGGDLTINDFDISIDSNEVASGVANTVTANTAISISELDVAGYLEGTWSCSDANGLTAAADLPSAGAATGTSLTLEPGSDVSCEITNDDIGPTLTLSKTLLNDNGGNLLIGDFDISIDGVEVVSGAANPVLSNTTINIAELDVAGYTEGTWSCTDATGLTPAADLPLAGAATGASVTLAPGAQVTCEITNDDIAPLLTLTKTLVNDNGGDLTINDFDISIDSTEVVSGVANTVAANTGITISELDLDGYTEGTWACVDSTGLTAVADLPSAGVATGATLTLAPGSDVNCSIVNDDLAPQLTLAKTVTNDNGGDLTAADFDISINGTEVANNAANPVASNTPITISELDLPGYTEGTWSCTDATGLTASADLPSAGAAAAATLTLAPGADVTCEITNDDIAPLLTLTKTLVNDNGGDLTIADFDVSVDGTEVNSGLASQVLANTAITISELDIPGYTEGTWACVDSAGLTATADLPTAGVATGATLTLAPGADVTCEIANDDVAPLLTLTKTLVNDNGGDLTIADFDIAVDGTEVISGLASQVAANSVINISELDVPGYTEGTWACTDATGLSATADLPTAGAATGATLTLAPGADVTCEITNDDIAPLLTLTKTLVNDNGGDLTIADFDIAVDGTEVISGLASQVQANTGITISELDIPGYTEGVWACTDATGLTAASDLPTAGVATGASLTLAPGAEVTCEITNDDVAPLLTLTKTLINDNGGELTIADFDIAVDGSEVINAAANTVLANVAITISELDVAGYTEGTWACTDANSLTAVADLPSAGAAIGTNLILEPGSDVTCEITNDDISPTLTLSKILINDDGGDLTIDDFDISIDTTEVVSGVANPVVANAAITISELDVAGYTEGTWSCTDATGLTAATDLPTAGVATGATVTLATGASVTCEITNDDIAPTLTLTKTVVNDNGGVLDIADFDISIDGTEVSSGAANVVAANTPILISELDLVPYAEGSWACTDATGLTAAADLPTAGLATATTLTLEPGSDVTCSITNNDLGIDLSIAKAVDDPQPNIGQTITFTLTVLNNGPDVATNATVNDVVPAGFTYVAGSISGGSTSDDTDPTGAGLSWTLATMPVGTPTVLSFDAVVNAP